VLLFDIEDWNFFGVWILEFEVFGFVSKASRILQHLFDRGIAGENTA